MEGESFADGLFVERVPVNQAILFKMLEDFCKFVASTTLFLFETVGVLLDVVNAVDLVDTVKQDDTRVRLLTFGSFFHGVNFTSKEVGKFIGVNSATNSGNVLSGFCSVDENNRSSGNLPFGFGILIEDRWSEDFPDFRKRFFFRVFLLVFEVGDIESNVADNAEIEQSTSVGGLKIFVKFAFRVKGGISAETTPSTKFIRIVSDNRNPKTRDMEQATDNSLAHYRIQLSFKILGYDTPNISCSEHSISGDVESDNSIVNATIEIREDCTSNDVVAVNNRFVVELNDTTATPIFSGSGNANVARDGELIIPSEITDFVFRRKNSVGSNEFLFLKRRFFARIIVAYNRMRKNLFRV